MTVIGFAASAVLPARAGEVLRPWLLARKEGLSATAAFATIILERVLDTVMVLLLFGLFLLLAEPDFARGDPLAFSRLKIGGAAGGPRVGRRAGGHVLPRGAPGARSTPSRQGSSACCRRGWRRPAHGSSGRSPNGLAIVRQPGRLAVALLLSVPLWLSIATGIWCVSRAFHIDLPFMGSFLVMALLVVGVAVPTPAGVGGFHYFYRLAATGFYAAPNDRAVGAAIVLHAVSFVPVAVVGLVLLAREGISLAGVGSVMRADGAEETRVKCPYCAHLGDKVVDSRESKEGEVIRRRRECLECGRRFTSYERIEEIPYMVIKKDGTRERFERQKLVAGLLKACEKRPVSVAAIDAVADRVESMLQERPEKEIPTADIGAFVMQELKHLDKVAYVRFASVYRHFRDIGEFMNELKDLLNARE